MPCKSQMYANLIAELYVVRKLPGNNVESLGKNDKSNSNLQIPRGKGFGWVWRESEYRQL